MSYNDQQNNAIPSKNNTNITRKTRTDLVKLIINFSFENEFHFCTIYQAVILMDKYLSMGEIESQDIEVIALSCLYLAVKIEEDYELISVNDLIIKTENKYNKEIFLKTERNILNKLGFQIYHGTVIEYLRKSYTNHKLSKENYCMALYLSILLLLTDDYRFIELSLLSKKITAFCLLLSMPEKIIAELIVNDPFYSHIYVLLQKSNKSNTCIIKKKFAIEKFQFVSLRYVPFIPNIGDIEKSLEDKYKINDNSVDIGYSSLMYTSPFNNITRLTHIGRGTYGDVEHIKILGEDFALKIASVFNRDETIDGIMLRELYSLATLDHPNIIKIKYFWYGFPKLKMYYVLELMETTMHFKILNYYIDEKTKQSYIIQLLEGLMYIHNKNIMHRDLSTANILISSDDIVKISDFGSSIYFRHPTYSASYNTNICSLNFRAVEVLIKEVNYTPAIDVWSCACVIGFILRGSFLFTGNNTKNLMFNILEILGTPKEIYDQQFCNKQHFERKGFVDLEKKYPEETKILYKMLEYDPNKRITVAQAYDFFIAIYQKKQ